MKSLSVLIASRNEMFLQNTVEDVLRNIRGNTEIIVVLDGSWADPPLKQDKRLIVIYHPKSIGQRACINDAARVSRAKYIMKLDAHCSVDEGFDVKMINDMQDDWTMVPKMYNLHVFDWICGCGYREYQGRSRPCPKCNGKMIRDIKWYAKPSPETTAMRFDKDLKFAYWGKYKDRQSGNLVETMSILGACFMLTRKKFFELNICDESHGGWGQMGTEVACATWLSGGKLIVNKNTWFAHCFRTQGGDFGFPYFLSQKDVNKARKYSKDLWFNNKHPRQIHKLSWLINKFAPVPGWEVTKGAVYYTDNRLDPKIMEQCQATIKLKTVSVSLKKLDFGTNIVLPLSRGYLTMFMQILRGLEAMDSDVVYLCEHDIMYHPSHFDFIPVKKDVFYYNTNVWKLDYRTGKTLHYDCQQTSGLCAYRGLLIEHYRKRVDMVKKHGFNRRMGFEPGTHSRSERVDDYKAESWQSKSPNIDIRHEYNLTPSRWNKDEFRNQKYTQGWIESEYIPNWGKGSELIYKFN